MRKKLVASWNAVTIIGLDYTKIYLASANLKFSELSTKKLWPANTDVGLTNIKTAAV